MPPMVSGLIVLRFCGKCRDSVFYDFFSVISKLRFIDIDEFHQREESMELSLFQNLVMRHIDAAKEKLLKK